MSQNMIQNLRGTWKLVSMTFKNENDEIVNFFGECPVGYLIYDDKGHMSAQFMMNDRSQFKSESFASGTNDELAQAFRSYQAYFGRYRAKEDESNVVIHRVEGCLTPNWTGHEEIRYVKFEDDCLVLTTPPTMVGEHEIIVDARWQRAS